MKKVLIIMFPVLMLFMLSGCIPGDGTYSQQNPAGLLWGIWHGWVAPISLIISIFNRSIRVYEVYNSGWAYDFGFYIAVISGFGGISLFRNKSKEKKD